MKLIIAVIKPFNMANDCEAVSVIPAETNTFGRQISHTKLSQEG